METEFWEGQVFRFPRSGRGQEVYRAVRQKEHWHVILEGHTDRWMFWVLSDARILATCWEYRLTD